MTKTLDEIDSQLSLNFEKLLDLLDEVDKEERKEAFKELRKILDTVLVRLPK